MDESNFNLKVDKRNFLSSNLNSNFTIQKKTILNDFKNSEAAANLIDNNIQAPKSTNYSLTKVSKKNSFLVGYSKIHELNLVTIGLASADKIQEWAEKVLPNGKILGEVTNANTLHYKTFKPTKGGLFCERIFGPLKDFECACGIRQKPSFEDSEKILDHLETKRKFCDICDVEYTWSVIRRYQLGYIQLTSPVTHMWYLKANPSYLSILLDVKKKKLESIIYCTETTTLENTCKALQNYGLDSSPTFVYLSWKQLLNQEKELTLTNKLTEKFLNKKIATKLQLQKKSVPTKLNNFNFLATKKDDLQNSTAIISQKINDNVILNKKRQKNEQLKLNKIFIPLLWKTIWYNFVQKTYLMSILQQNNIWSNIQDSFNNKKNNVSEFDELEFHKLKSLSNLKKIIFLTEQTKLALHSLNQKNNMASVIFLNNDSSNKQFKNFITQKAIKNPFFVTKNLYINEDKAEKRNFESRKNRLILKQPLNPNLNNSKSNLSRLSNRRNKHELSSLIKNYLLFSLLIVLDKNETISQLAEKFTKIPFKVNFFKKLNNTLLKNSQNLQKILLFRLNKLNSKNQLNLLIALNVTFQNAFKWFFKNSETNQIRKFKFKKNYLTLAEKQHFLYNLKDWSNEPVMFEMNIFSSYQNLQKFVFQKSEYSDKIVENLNLPLISVKNSKKIQSQKSQFYKSKKHFKQQNQKYPIFNYETSYALKKSTPKSQVFVNDSVSLSNNIYCISFFYTWDLERDWKYFLYYVSGTSNFVDVQIPFYRTRTLNLSELNIHNSIAGASLIQKLLGEFQSSELTKISKQHQLLLPKIRKKIRQLKSFEGKIPRSNIAEIEKLLKKRDHIMRRLKIIRQLIRKNTNPRSMILSKLPVLPPDLRPILKLEDQIAASDLNTLYQRIIFRNDRLKKFLKDPAISQSFEAKYAQRLLQEAVDNLIQNGKGNVKPETNSRGQALKSLSEILKGKQGRFRQYLLGKRVDYSGRSVIVVGPKLKLNECGLPKEMALELFLPFLIKRILHYKLASTIIGAKNLIKTKQVIIWDLLSEVMQNHPVLLNRAPTLHRLGIQAFQPKLIEGRAILIHPLVCPAFNADFDGDQMAVHVPMTVEARVESWKLMFSGNNLISPATGEPIVLPSQDMVLGCYYLTTDKFRFQQNQIRKIKKFKKKSNQFFTLNAKNFLSRDFLPSDLVFQNPTQVLKAYQLDLLNSHSPIWLKWNGVVEMKSTKFEPIELQISGRGSLEEIYSQFYRRFDPQLNCIYQFIKTTPGRIFFNEIIQKYIKSKQHSCS